MVDKEYAKRLKKLKKLKSIDDLLTPSEREILRKDLQRIADTRKVHMMDGLERP